MDSILRRARAPLDYTPRMLQDVRIAGRRVLRAPAFSVTVVAILALGAGATTTMVSILDALLWRPIPVLRSHELVSVSSVTADGARRTTPLRAIEGLAGANLPVDGWCGYITTILATEAGGTNLQASIEVVTGGYFRAIGVRPALGRVIEPDEAPVRGQGKPVAVVTHRYWQRMFGADPNVLGRTLRIDTATVSVVGVMPAGFSGLQKDLAVDIIVPFNSIRPTANVTSFVGRLQPGHPVAAVRSQIVTLWPAILAAAATPASGAAERPPDPLQADVQPLTAGFSLFRRLYSAPLMAVTGLAAVLLLLTCITVGGLLVSRVAADGSAIAVMRSLGAGSGRIARQLFAECLMLAASGCAIGVALAYAAGRAFPSLLPVGLMPWTIALTPDLRIMSVVAVLAAVLALAVAALPMWLATRGTIQLRTDRTVARATSRWANALLVGQLAATVVLVFACGLIVRSLTGLASVDRGFRPDRILSVRLTPNPAGYQNFNQVLYYPALVERAASLPGVQSVGFARYFGTINAQLPEQPVAFAGTDATTSGVLEYISPHFFDTVGIPLLGGRDVAWSDLPSSPRVVIVSESLARALAPDGNVVGKVIRYGPTPAMQRLEIVGVAGNVSLGNFRQNDVRIVYVPAVQAGEATFATLHLRTESDPLTLVKPATDLVHGFAREHVQRASTVDDLFGNGLVPERMGAIVSSVAAGLAVILAGLGVYALLAHSIARRTREIGIRIALGASPAAVRGLVARHALALVAGGLALGVPAAIGGASMLRSLLYGVTTTDGFTLVACSAVLVAIGVLAALRPAARALRVDPMCSLRAE